MSALMSWLVVFMTIIFPPLLMLLPVMGLVELDRIQLESVFPKGKDRARHS